MGKRLFILLLSFVLASTSAYAAIPVALSDQGTEVRNKTTSALLVTGDLIVEVWDSPTAGTMIYTESFPDAIVNGSWNVMIGENTSNPLLLEFDKQYYREYTINGEDADFTNSSGDISERQLFYSPLGDVSGEDINTSANVTINRLNVTTNITVGNATSFFNGTHLGVGTENPLRTAHISANIPSIITILAIENTNDTDGVGAVLSFRAPTTGPDATNFTEFSAIQAIFEEHDNATQNSTLGFFIKSSGTLIEPLHIAENGSVGINTTFPNGSLNLLTANDTHLIIGTTGNTSAPQLGFFQNTSSIGAFVQYRAVGNSLPNILRLGTFLEGGQVVIATNSSDEAMRIDSSGFVGINTTDPNATLHVIGNISVGFATVNISSDGITFPDGTFQDSAAVGANPTLQDVTDNGNSTTQPIHVDTDGDENSSIGGNLGIGTTTPGSKLEVNGTARITENLTVGNGSVFINGSYVSIGAFPPFTVGSTTSNLDVNGSIRMINPLALFIFGPSTAEPANIARSSSELLLRASGSGSDRDVNIVTSASGTPLGRIFMDNETGNVAIGGSVGPLATLNVNGSFRVDRSGAGGVVIFTNETTGLVGINTTSPNTTLAVQGNATFLGSVNITGNLSVGGGTTTIGKDGITYPDNTFQGSAAGPSGCSIVRELSSTTATCPVGNVVVGGGHGSCPGGQVSSSCPASLGVCVTSQGPPITANQWLISCGGGPPSTFAICCPS